LNLQQIRSRNESDSEDGGAARRVGAQV